MSATRIFTPENRLAMALEGIETVPVQVLAAEAERRVARMGAAIRAYVAEKLEVITRYASQSDEALFGECRGLGSAALDIAEVAAAAEMDAIGEVACGIRTMIDALLSSGVWHTDALRLHIDALFLLNQTGGRRDAENEIILARLRTMRDAIGVTE